MFKQHQLPEIDAVPAVPVESVKPAATYSFAYTQSYIGEGAGMESTRATLSQEFAQVLTESSQFASVREAESGGDVHIEARLHNSGNPAALIPAVITGFSLYTIPSWATEHWKLTADVSRSTGDPHSYTLEDSDMLVQWLPMILVFPFSSPFTVIPEVRKNMYKNLLKSMRGDDGFEENAVTVVSSGAHGLSDEEIDARLKIASDKLLEGLWRSEELGGELVILADPFAGKPTNPFPFASFYGFPVEEVSGGRTYGEPVMFINDTHAGSLFSVKIKREGMTSRIGTTMFGWGENTIEIELPASEAGKMETIRLIRVRADERE